MLLPLGVKILWFVLSITGAFWLHFILSDPVDNSFICAQASLLVGLCFLRSVGRSIPGGPSSCMASGARCWRVSSALVRAIPVILCIFTEPLDRHHLENGPLFHAEAVLHRCVVLCFATWCSYECDIHFATPKCSAIRFYCSWLVPRVWCSLRLLVHDESNRPQAKDMGRQTF